MAQGSFAAATAADMALQSQGSTIAAPAGEPSRRKWMTRTGWGLSGLMIAFLVFDSVGKIMLERHVVEATTKIGYPLDVIRALGLICLACTILYAIPRTSILGALLLTGYLGGAIASKVRIEDPLFGSVLFGVYFGIALWGGLWLRDARLRTLIPLRLDPQACRPRREKTGAHDEARFIRGVSR